MDKKKIMFVSITLVMFAYSCGSTKQATERMMSKITTNEQMFWNHFQKVTCDSLGWVNPSEFSTYKFSNIDSILSWGENLWIGFVEKKDYRVGNVDIIVMQWSLGSGEWSPFFTVYIRNETKWQLCTAKTFSHDCWNKIKIEQNDEKEVFKFVVDDKPISELHYSKIVSMK